MYFSPTIHALLNLFSKLVLKFIQEYTWNIFLLSFLKKKKKKKKKKNL